MPSARAFLTAPNLVSFARLPLAIAFWLAPGGWPRALILLAGAFSDFLDGWLARRRSTPSPGGALIDPITDKTFVLAVLAALAVDGSLAPWETALLLIREVFVVFGFIVVLAARSEMKLQARMPGKVATNLQLLALFVGALHPPATPPFSLLAGVGGVVAVLDYGKLAVRSLRARPRSD
jgi:phosphatidylglycerophosphate synthase